VSAVDASRLLGHATLLGFLVAGAAGLPLGVPHAAHVQVSFCPHRFPLDR
jgi:hypothetical protein